MWHSFPSPGSENSRALTSSCQLLNAQCTMGFSVVILRVLGGRIAEKWGRFSWVISHLTGMTGPSKPTKLVLERQTHIVGYSFILSQLLPGLPLPWAALWGGGWDSTVHISALLAGALLVSRRDCGAGGRRRDLLLPFFLWGFVHQHFVVVAVPSHDSSSMQLQIFNPVQPLHSSPLRNSGTRHPHRSVFNSRDTLCWGVKFLEFQPLLFLSLAPET